MEKKCNSGQWWNSDKCQCEYKKRHVCEKICILNPATCSCENGKYLASIMGDAAIMCDEIIVILRRNKNYFNFFQFCQIFVVIYVNVRFVFQ